MSKPRYSEDSMLTFIKQQNINLKKQKININQKKREQQKKKKKHSSAVSSSLRPTGTADSTTFLCLPEGAHGIAGAAAPWWTLWKSKEN